MKIKALKDKSITGLLAQHAYATHCQELEDLINKHDRETHFEQEIRKAMEYPLRSLSKPVAALFQEGTAERSDLLFVNNGDEVWGDERFEGAALNALERIRASVRSSVEANLECYMEDLGHYLAGILMQEPASKKRPGNKSRRG